MDAIVRAPLPSMLSEALPNSRARRVERWRAHGRVRWHIHGFRRGPQSGSPGDVSSALPKIPDVEFSPVRLQAEACLHQPCPAHRATEVKRQVRIPSGTPWFDMAFVACVPPADSAGPFRYPARLGLTQQRPPRPTGPSLREGYVVLPLLATMTRCADLDDSPGLPRDRLVIPGALPDDLVWAAIETVPTLSHSPLSACQCLYAGGIDGCTGPDPSPSSSPSPSKGGLGSLIPCPWLFDRPVFRRISSLRSRSGPQSCSPLDQAHPLRGSRDFYTRAFLTAGHPTAKSGITTQLSGLLLRRNLHPLGKCCYGLQLRSTGITPLRRYCGPVRHPLAVRPLPRVTGYSLDLAPPLSRRGEEGFSSCSTCPRHRAVALTPPERPAASASCDGPCCLRLSTVRLGLRGLSLSGPPVRSLPLRPGDSLTILPMASSMGFRVSVSLHPATRVTGLWLLPRRD